MDSTFINSEGRKKKLFQPSGSSNLCNLPNFLATKSPDPKGLRVPLAPVQLVNPIQCPSQSQSFAILECQFAVVFHFFDQLVFGSFFFSVNLRFGEKQKLVLKWHPMDISIYIFITNKFVAVTNASMQINF